MPNSPLADVEAVSSQSPAEVKQALIAAIAANDRGSVVNKRITLRWREGTQPDEFDGIRRPNNAQFKYKLTANELSGRIANINPWFGGQMRLLIVISVNEAVFVPAHDVETGLAT